MPLIVYKSSAGSGKTYTLVMEYLRLVLVNPLSFKNILAITFTNKATAEMKNRLLETLASLAAGAEDSHKLVEQLLTDPEQPLNEETIRFRASRVLQLIIHNYSEFSVSTIDSFMHRVVRTFAFDLQLPVNFEVELEHDVLVDRAVSNLLQRVGSDQEITALLTGFVKTLVDDEKGWDIRHGLTSIAETLFDEREREGASPLRELSPMQFLKIHLAIRRQIGNLEQQLREGSKRLLERLVAEGVTIDDTHRTRSGFFFYIQKLAIGDFSNFIPNRYVHDVLSTRKWESGKCRPEAKQALYANGELIAAELGEIVAFAEQHHEQYRTLQAVAENFFPTATLALLDQLLMQVARENNLVHLSEFNRRIASVVLHEPVPFIYARLGEKYRHFLIDEFQDTSIMQWHNLLPLAHNTLASDDGTSKAGKVMIVGDSKQSIYRWRNGETEQFQLLPLIFQKPDTPWFDDAERTLSLHYQPHHLATNYRSSVEVIEFNNRFFKQAAHLLPQQFQPVYANPEQKAAGGKNPGRVEIKFLDRNTDRKGKDGHLAFITETITTLLDEGYALSQIAVLCRGNDDCALVAQHLLKQQIAVVSSESLLLASSPKVSAVVLAFRMLNQPQNPVHRESLKRLMKVLQHSPTAPPVEPESLLSRLVTLPFYDLAEAIVRQLGFDREHDPYIQFFLDTVQEFSRKDYRGLAGFVEWWDDQRFRRSVQLPDGANAVQVMTIHKSKGLAFGAVIIPFVANTLKPGRSHDWIFHIAAGEEILPAARVRMTKKALDTSFASNYTLEMNKSRLDTLNLLYVAFTRARERLFVSADTPPQQTDHTGAASIIQSVLQLEWPNLQDINPFVFGEKTDNAPLAKRTLRSEEPLHKAYSGSHDWREMISTAGNYPETAKQQAQIDYGLLVHRLLSEIRNASDISQVLDKAKSGGQLDNATADAVTNSLHRILNMPECAPLFRAENVMKNEAALLLPDGSILRPDRVVLESNKTWVVDFKTGKPNASHHQQVARYAATLRAMELPDVQGMILYLSEPPFVEFVAQ